MAAAPAGRGREGRGGRRQPVTADLFFFSSFFSSSPASRPRRPGRACLPPVGRARRISPHRPTHTPRFPSGRHRPRDGRTLAPASHVPLGLFDQRPSPLSTLRHTHTHLSLTPPPLPPAHPPARARRPSRSRRTAGGRRRSSGSASIGTSSTRLPPRRCRRRRHREGARRTRSGRCRRRWCSGATVGRRLLRPTMTTTTTTRWCSSEEGRPPSRLANPSTARSGTSPLPPGRAGAAVARPLARPSAGRQRSPTRRAGSCGRREAHARRRRPSWQRRQRPAAASRRRLASSSSSSGRATPMSRTGTSLCPPPRPARRTVSPTLRRSRSLERRRRRRSRASPPPLPSSPRLPLRPRASAAARWTLSGRSARQRLVAATSNQRDARR